VKTRPVCHTTARRQHADTCSGLIHRRMQGVRWSKDSLPPYRVVFLATQATQMEYIESVDQQSGSEPAHERQMELC
jgi:hypothetical protein